MQMQLPTGETEESAKDDSESDLDLNEIDPAKPKSIFNPLNRKIALVEYDVVKNIAEAKHINTCTGFILAPVLKFDKNEDDSFNATGNVNHSDQNLILIKLLNDSILKSFNCTSIKIISCGFEHWAALTSFGTVATWGYGASGCLGHNSYTSYTSPKLVQFQSKESENSEYLSNITSLEWGGYHTCCIDSSNNVYSWGRGDVGQLGLYKEQLKNDKMGMVWMKPCLVEYFADIPIVQVAWGEAHTIVLDKWGRLFSFGWNQLGQLGVTDNNKIIQGIPKVSKIYCGAIFSLAVCTNGKVYTWGSGENGQLGLGVDVKETDSPSKVGEGTYIQNEHIIDAIWGNSHVIVISDSGKMFGWGQGISENYIEKNDLIKNDSVVELKSFDIYELVTVESVQKLMIKILPQVITKPKQYYSRKWSPEKQIEISTISTHVENENTNKHRYNKTTLIRNNIPNSKVPFTKTPFNKS